MRTAFFQNPKISVMRGPPVVVPESTLRQSVQVMELQIMDLKVIGQCNYFKVSIIRLDRSFDRTGHLLETLE